MFHYDSARAPFGPQSRCPLVDPANAKSQSVYTQIAQLPAPISEWSVRTRMPLLCGASGEVALLP